MTEPVKPRNQHEEWRDTMRDLGSTIVPGKHIPGQDGPKDWQINLILLPIAIFTVVFFIWLVQQ